MRKGHVTGHKRQRRAAPRETARLEALGTEIAHVIRQQGGVMLVDQNDTAPFGRVEVVKLLEAVEAYWRTPQCHKQDFLPLRQKLHGLVFGDPHLATYRAFTIVIVDDEPLRRYTKMDFSTQHEAQKTCQLWSREMDADWLAVAGIRPDGTLVRLS